MHPDRRKGLTDRDQLLNLFRFLTDHQGFSEVSPVASDTSPRGVRVQYAHPKLRIAVSHDDRDGFVCDLTLPGEAKISVGILIAALRPDGSVTQSSFVSPRDQADFLRTQLHRLLDMPREVLDDFVALRFYHAGPWRAQWGNAIQMDPESIQIERARLDRLRNYFQTLPRG